MADGSFVCRERANRGPIAIAQHGADILFVLGPATATRAAWSSAGNCASSKKWVREIVR